MKFHAQIAMIVELEASTIENAEATLDNAIDGTSIRQHGITVISRHTLVSIPVLEPIVIPRLIKDV